MSTSRHESDLLSSLAELLRGKMDAKFSIVGRIHEELPDWMTLEEVAVYLQVSKHTVYHWRRNGGGPSATTLGKHLRFAKEDVLSFARAGRRT